MSPTSMATWLNPMSFAWSSTTPLSTRQGRPATPQTSWALSGTAGTYAKRRTRREYEVNVSEGQRTRWLPSELRQDRVRHGLEGVYVVHLQPLQHYSLHTGFGEMSEPLDDLARRPGEDGGGKVILQLTFELAVYVGLCATEDDARHQGSAYLFGHPPCLAHQFVEP